ncbi:HEAT repeat domain-containing protein [Pantoea sp. LMR881]|uniref:HEAT repeat domain-containing protein n=1 Tax=Pantoea sp. LMR881 TaxID=3014336 RepID=UPI0022AEDF68|nr:HEAT repeat domain-containing protein [Pantoea sp. LMR881]MCZ4058208.1 HEAT repeat domain-containing protein [Pantoea sp. LMR881]
MTPAVGKRLLDACAELDNDIKIAAIYALGESADTSPAVIQKLLDLSTNLNNDVKIAALKALGRVSRNK